MTDDGMVVAEPAPRELRGLLSGAMLGSLLIVAVWIALVLGQLGRPHPNNVWVEQSYAHKSAIAAELDGPRVLVIGGSSTLFGLDTPLLAELLHRPAVNLGVNAGIGAPHVIANTRDLVRAGDLVLLPIEYGLYNYHRTINQAFLDYSLSHPAVLAGEPWHFWVRVGWHTSLQRVWQGYRGVPAGFRPEGLYGPQNQNEYGDQLNAALRDRHPDLYAGALHSRVERHGTRFREDGLGWQLWNEFAENLTEQGACVLFVPPAMMERAEYHEDAIESRFYAQLPDHARAVGLPYVGDPRDFFYPVEWFFDTNYHLAEEHRPHHTRALAALVRQANPECLAGR